MEDKEKRCARCHQFKPITEFTKRSRSADGREHRCKPCHQAYLRQLYYKFADERKVKSKEYYETHKERKLEMVARRNSKNIYGGAPKAVAKALRDGTLLRQPCEVCSEPLAQFHHSKGYAEENYLVGVWLCKTHHAAEHVKIRNLAREAA